MLKLPKCHILTQDDLFPEVDGALVVVTGESPNATVKISLPDHEARKFRTMDRLTRASYSSKGDTWTFSGVSDHLVNVIGATRSEAVMSVMVTPEPGCEDCRK